MHRECITGSRMVEHKRIIPLKCKDYNISEQRKYEKDGRKWYVVFMIRC